MSYQDTFDQWLEHMKPYYQGQVDNRRIENDFFAHARRQYAALRKLDRETPLDLLPEDQAFVDSFMTMNRRIFELCDSSQLFSQYPVVLLGHRMVYYRMSQEKPVDYHMMLCVGTNGNAGILMQQEFPERRPLFPTGITMAVLGAMRILMPYVLTLHVGKGIDPDE